MWEQVRRPQGMGAPTAVNGCVGGGWAVGGEWEGDGGFV